MSLFPKSNELGRKNNSIRFVKLFPQGQGELLVKILFVSTEVAFYNYQLSKKESMGNACSTTGHTEIRTMA